MKSIKRRLLSLLLAMAMVLTLAPGALAADFSSSITANPSTIAVGESTSISLTYTLPDNATLKDIEWSASPSTNVTLTPSQNKESATLAVDSNFVGTSVTVYCDVQYTDGINVNTDNFATTTVTVTGAQQEDPVATGITIKPTTAVEVEVGKTTTLTATVAGDSGVSQTVTWSSSDDTTATVNPSTGVVTGVKAGPVTITATSEAKGANGQPVTDTKDITVKDAAPTVSVSLAPSSATIYDNTANNSTTLTLTTTGDISAYTPSVVVTSGNASLVTITQNVNGTFTVTANTTVNQNTIVKLEARLTSGQTVVRSNEVSITIAPYTRIVVNNVSGSPSIGSTVYLDNWTDYNNAGSRTFSVSATLYNGDSVVTSAALSYQWYLNGTAIQGATTASYTLYSYTYGLEYANKPNSLVCRVTSTNNQYIYTEATWDVRTGYASNSLATATVSTTTSSYALGDVDDAGKSSIVSQLDSYFYNTTNRRYGLAYVTFSSVRDGNNGSLNASVGTQYYADRQGTGSSIRYLADVLFYPGNSKTTASFPATFYYYTSSNYSTSSITSVTGSITFTVTEDTSTGDITYTGELGKDVYFDLKDFEDFYYNKTRGTLSYVSFTLPSGGTLYADGGRLNSSNACYASPSRTQTDLAGVYFSPTGTTATRPSTVRVSFTAYGTRYTSGTSGTVVINYLSGTAKDITYTPTGTTAISLRASDFTDAYRQAVGSTAPSGLTIQFQDVPTYGTLSYKDSSRTNSSAVTLRTSNVKNYKFTTRTSGTNQLGDVSYTPSGTRSDTISYIAYNGNTPQFTGKVVFNPATTSTTMYVTFTGTSPLSLSYQEFVKSNAVVMASCTGVRIDSAPVSGTLTYSGAAVTAGVTTIQPALLGNVSYRPSVSGNVHDKVNFTCLDASGGILARGQIDLIVTGSTGSVTFTDVPSTAWYASDLNTLISRGIIQGRGDGKFDPTAELKVGEALKIFMLASGYPVQQEATGKNWAVNYKNLAVSNGWIRDDVDLDAKISRNDMAELAARSLGISSSSAASPWSDNANGYAVALYYTSPQILKGDETGTFRGGSTLRRQEICAIAARVISYKESQQSAQRPGWLS